jgi:SAM-dependent methyltransferase
MPICRLCGALDVKDLGEIPDSDYFSGRVLAESIRGGQLFRCGECRSMFRHPVLPASKYLELYNAGKPTQWSGGTGRQDLGIIKSILTAGSRTKILDVGCGTGDFLCSLPVEYRKCGIEPSGAARHAAARGIEIIGAEIKDLADGELFDVITLIDVIEHVADPLALLDDVGAHVSPGGLIIVSTGDPDFPMWRRFFRARYWYVGFPEHISFPSAFLFGMWCKKNHAVACDAIATRYQLLGRGRLALNFFMQMAFYVSPAAFSWVGRLVDLVRGAPKPRRRTFCPGVPGLFIDHHVLIIETSSLNGRRKEY